METSQFPIIRDYKDRNCISDLNTSRRYIYILYLYHIYIYINFKHLKLLYVMYLPNTWGLKQNLLSHLTENHLGSLKVVPHASYYL